jgi:hypothetical protein
VRILGNDNMVAGAQAFENMSFSTTGHQLAISQYADWQTSFFRII